jgi:uncharacterized protein (DUF1330 family)
MAFTTFNMDNLATFKANFPPDEPVYMLNMIRYHAIATYSSPQPDLPEASGRAVYHDRYVPSLAPLIARGVLKLFFVGAPHPALCGPADERWDEIVLVEYPNMAAFEQMVASDEYRTNCNPHRDAATADLRLIPIARTATTTTTTT